MSIVVLRLKVLLIFTRLRNIDVEAERAGGFRCLNAGFFLVLAEYGGRIL